MSKSTNWLVKAFGQFMKQSRSTIKVREIGEDHLGNKYFEEIRSNSPRGMHRYFRPKDYNEEDELRNYQSVPPLWDAWLRFRRKDPPTEEEMKNSDKYFDYQQALAKRSEDTDKKIAKGQFPKLVFKDKTEE